MSLNIANISRILHKMSVVVTRTQWSDGVAMRGLSSQNSTFQKQEGWLLFYHVPGHHELCREDVQV